MSRLALITYLNGRDVDPGYGVNAPGHPSQGLPGYGRPDQSLPGLPPGAVTLPVFPWDPTIDNSLPGGGGHPRQSTSWWWRVDRINHSRDQGGRPDQFASRLVAEDRIRACLSRAVNTSSSGSLASG